MGDWRGVLLAVLVVALLAGLGVLARRRHRRDLGTPADRATFATLHTASLASPPLRAGLTAASAERAIRHLRALLGTPAVALTDDQRVLAWDGGGAHHADELVQLAHSTLASGRTHAHGDSEVGCSRGRCELRGSVIAPLIVEDRVVGTLVVLTDISSASLVRATTEVARWVSGQLELAELDKSRTALIEAEVRALRAQISPHFVYNSLTAIASFVRTDPERARALLVEFADYTRYSFRRQGEFTTLAEELRAIERYLVLEQARFGDRLVVTLRVAPEVLPVRLPFLSVQPLVENAIRHGLEHKAGVGHVTITAEDDRTDALITIEDDGVGEDPERMRRVLAGDAGADSVGLGNVDERLRSVFGDEYGLVVETAVDAGTKVLVRIPKFAPGVGG
ncbi:MAG: histidine kinase [Nocardioidaceae bacterium]|nr:histidine kinase [Nocardioidaceae bacterium]